MMNSILLTHDGSKSLQSERYGVGYHSRYGAVTESAHGFIGAGLRYKAVVQSDIRILETGFGTGLNAMMTLAEAEKRNLTVEYLGLETHPVSSDDVAHLEYPAYLEMPHLEQSYLFMHSCDWEVPLRLTDFYTFRKSATPIEVFCLPHYFDLIYFDAFAPQAQPELWELPVLERMFSSLRSEGALVTYCAQGAFRRNLKQAGFHIEKLQGPPGKREMTRAIK